MLRYWLCKLGLHDWEIYTEGHLHEGFVYPLRFRTCRICSKHQQEILNKSSQTTQWLNLNNKR